MIRFNLLLRFASNKFNVKATTPTQSVKCFSTKKNSSSSSSTSSSSSDDEQKKAANKKKSEEARQKLNLLLNKMIQDDATTKQTTKLELAKPKDRRRKDVRTEPGTESIKSESVGQQVVKAVKNVAESIGGDVKQTESELLQKLLNPVKDQQTQTPQETASNLSEIFKDMKIDRETKAGAEISRAQQVRQLLQGVKPKYQPGRPKTGPRKPRHHLRDEQGEMHIMEERVDIFGGDRLGIFPSVDEIQKWDKPEFNKTWKAVQERELRLAITHPPANYFQQMILWTEQKKLWKFPIDNEQDLIQEKSVYFAEHVFLEKHLESWCPTKGPIRHFMELVCVGLSKNPYLTVEKKKEHIEWFRNYFNEKQQVLLDVGAISSEFKMDEKITKKIEA